MRIHRTTLMYTAEIRCIIKKKEEGRKLNTKVELIMLS